MNRRPSLLLVLAVAVVTVACSARLPASSSPVIPIQTSGAPTPSQVPRASASVVTPSPPIVAVPDAVARLDCEEPQVRCEVSLVDASGGSLPGWPVPVDGPCPGTATDPVGRLYVACEGNVGPTVHAFDAAGSRLIGWPLSLPDAIAWNSWNDFSGICGRSLAPLAIDAEGNVYIATMDPEAVPLVRMLHSFGSDGKERPGWPQPLPGRDNEFGCGGFALAPDGTIRAWGYEGPPPVEIELGYGPFAARTVYTALAADGEVLAGWPLGSTGTGSGPLIGADGTLYHLTEAGNLWAHDSAGEAVVGWPYRSAPGLTPYLTPDGRIIQISSGQGTTIRAIGRGGVDAPGWPYELAAARETSCIVGEVDCFGWVEPAIGLDGTLYLAMAGPRPAAGGAIVAIDLAGTAVAGWPVPLADRTRAIGLEMDGAGNLVIELAQCSDDDCASGATYVTRRLSPAGEVLG